MLKLSDYTVISPLPTVNEYLLYNSFTGEIANIQDEQGKIIGKTQWDQKTLSEDRDTFQQLCNMGFLVRDGVNEKEIVKKSLWESRFDTEELEVHISPTYSCNLKCSYCYQKDYNRSQVMSDATCKQMLSWIERKLDEYRSRKLKIRLLGGEVLVKINLLEIICRELIKITTEKGIELDFYLTTNGTLLNSSYIKRLKTWGINTVKITIDGDQTTHNLSRPFSNGKGSFQRIIKNITDHYDKLNIVLRCNYSQDNLDSIPRLLDYLAEKKLNNHLKYIELQPVLNKSDFSQINNQHCNKSIFNDLQIKQLLWLSKEAIDRGFQLNDEFHGGRCPAFFKSSFLIDPLGDIYKCPAFLGDKKNSIGHVHNDRLNYLNEIFLADESWNDCLDCPYVPVCCGGCRFVAQERFGSFLGNKICDKEYYEKVGIEVLKLIETQKNNQEELAIYQ